nr:hypothetical protein CFP56_60550 [Quercus suber]
MFASEKDGGNVRPEGQMKQFRKMINRCNLRDLGCKGSAFTWRRRLGNHGWIQERLDRALVSTNWVGMFPRTKLFHIASSTSNHSILLLKDPTSSWQKFVRSKLFRFEAIWLRGEACSKVVQDAWARGENRGSQWPLACCLEECQSTLSLWNKNVFGHVGRKVSALQRKPQILENLNMGGAVLDDLHETRLELNDALAIEEDMWLQSQWGSSTNLDTTGGVNTVIHGVPVYIPNSLDLAEIGHRQFLPERDPSGWELPFLQGWLVGQSHAGGPSVLPLNDDGSSREPSAQYINFSILASHLSTQNITMLGGISLPGISGRSSLQYRFSNSHFSVSDSVEGAALVNAPSDWVDAQPIISRIQLKITTLLAAVATAELPFTVKLRVWPHDVENPFAPLNAERCCLPYPMLSCVGYRVSDMELVGVLPSVEDEVWSMLLAFIHLLEEVLLLEERKREA